MRPAVDEDDPADFWSFCGKFGTLAPLWLLLIALGFAVAMLAWPIWAARNIARRLRAWWNKPPLARTEDVGI